MSSELSTWRKYVATKDALITRHPNLEKQVDEKRRLYTQSAETNRDRIDDQRSSALSASYSSRILPRMDCDVSNPQLPDSEDHIAENGITKPCRYTIKQLHPRQAILSYSLDPTLSGIEIISLRRSRVSSILLDWDSAVFLVSRMVLHLYILSTMLIKSD